MHAGDAPYRWGMERRFLGMGFSSRTGRWAAEFDELSAQADEVGVRWRDLVADGYRVGGDLYAGGVLIQYDWKWRVDELRRRLRERGAPQNG